MFSITRFILSLTVILIGCGDNSRPGPPASHTLYLEQGSTNGFLVGTNTQTQLTGAEIKSWAGMWPIEDISIGSRTALSQLAAIWSPEGAAKRPHTEVTVGQLQYTISASGLINLSDRFTGIRFEFEELSNGHLKLAKLNGAPAELLHFSQDQTQKKISLLIRRKSDQMLQAFYLFREWVPQPNSQTRDYRFLNGRLSRWSQSELKIELCGPAVSLEVPAREAVAQWQKALGNKLKLQLVLNPDGYPPFSDINHSCVYLISDYRTSASKTNSNFGQTFMVRDYNGSWVDGDIFIFQHELDKLTHSSVKMTELLQFALLHEIGHLLGLDHPPKDVQDSVMRYQLTPQLQPYDIQTLRDIYK